MLRRRREIDSYAMRDDFEFAFSEIIAFHDDADFTIFQHTTYLSRYFSLQLREHGEQGNKQRRLPHAA